jgi:hypothetical protein
MHKGIQRKWLLSKICFSDVRIMYYDYYNILAACTPSGLFPFCYLFCHKVYHSRLVGLSWKVQKHFSLKFYLGLHFSCISNEISNLLLISLLSSSYRLNSAKTARPISIKLDLLGLHWVVLSYFDFHLIRFILATQVNFTQFMCSVSDDRLWQISILQHLGLCYRPTCKPIIIITAMC